MTPWGQARWRGSSRSAARNRCSSPSTPISRRGARARARPVGSCPRKYWHCYDLFVALTAAAVATSRLRVGSGICLIIERDPIITAKEVASIDHLSGGRLLFGVGAGWNREEMRNHGTDPRTRMALMRERVEAMKAIWTQEEASYTGEFVAFERIWSHPKPAQRPHPPVLIGGDGPTVLDRVLAFGDGWLPNYSPGERFFERDGGAARARRAADRGRRVRHARRPARARARARRRSASGACTGCRPAGAGGRGGARALGVGDRRAERRVTDAEARRRFAAARVAHLATADAAGRPHLRADHVRARRATDLQRRRRQAEAHRSAASAGQRRRQPRRSRARRPLRRRRLGARCGGCGPMEWLA